MDYLYALQCIREAGPDFVNYIFLFISEFFFMSGIFIATYIYWCEDKYAGRAILVGYGAAGLVNQTVKNIACVYRPWVLDPRLHVDPHAAGSATGYSFPSGHTAAAASVFGGISIWQRKKKWVVVLMSVCIFLVAFSRNWLGAHTIQDVLVSIMAAAIVLSLCAIIKYWLSRHPEKDTLVCFGGIAITIIILVIMNLKPYPKDYDANGELLVNSYDMITDCFTTSGVMIAVLLGMWLERHFVQFEMCSSGSEKAKVFLFGALVVGIIYFGFSYLFKFTGEHWCHFIKYFSLFFTILYLYPLIFSYVRRRRS